MLSQVPLPGGLPSESGRQGPLKVCPWENNVGSWPKPPEGLGPPSGTARRWPFGSWPQGRSKQGDARTKESP